MIELRVTQFITHKKAENEGDCQDACCINEEMGRYAVADGATRSFFPKEWAILLVKNFCHKTGTKSYLSLDKRNWKTWLKPIQKDWFKQVAIRVKERPVFYLVNSLIAEESAVSTFVGLEIDKDNGKWKAMIMGDSCLFHISDIKFESYLIRKSSDFTNRPEAFASFAKDNLYEPSFEHGQAQPGDTFILATDALAKWILENMELGNKDFIARLTRIVTDSRFDEFVDTGRADENVRLDNDDVTLMIVSVEKAKGSRRNERTTQLLILGMVLFGFSAFCCMLLYYFRKD